MLKFFGEFPPTLDHKKEINIDLVVWHDPIDGDLKYVYTPSANINFATYKTTQTLIVNLVFPHDQVDRFKIHSYSVRHKKMCPQAHYDNGGVFVKQPETDGHLFTKLPVRVKFDLELVGKGTYITINVIDIKSNQIIDCDPQVENGTKT